MSRAILIEDRPERQRIFLERKKVNLDEFNCLRNLNGGNDPARFKKSFLDEGQMEKELTRFDVIMTHRSAWGSEIRMSLREFCQAEKKALVYFSGGISSTTFYQKDKFQFLTMNSGDFYGSHLSLFLASLTNDSPVNLRILAFGDNWKFELLSKLRMRLLNALQSKILPSPPGEKRRSLKDTTNIGFFNSAFGLDDEYLKGIIDTDSALSEKLKGPVVQHPDELANELLLLIKLEIQQLGFAQ